MAHTFGTSLSNNECLLDYVNPPMWVPIQRDIGEDECWCTKQYFTINLNPFSVNRFVYRLSDIDSK